MRTRALPVPLRQSLNRWSRLVSVFMASWMLWACNGDQGPTGNDVTSPVALGVSGSLAAAVQDGGRGGAATGQTIPGQYLVQFRDDVQDPPGLARQLVAQSGGQLRYTYTTALKGFAATLSDAAVSALKRNPRVILVEPDVVVTADTIAESAATWGLDRVDQRPLPLNSTYDYLDSGTGVTVYIVDTGIRYTHTEFEGRASFGFDALGGDGLDCHGHGTHVAGTVGGKTYGVAKGVKLVSVRVLGCNGSGSASSVIAGLDWISRDGARPGVANLSVGGAASSAMDNGVESLFEAGIVTAVAAGNSNIDACTVSPARAASAMTVGASDWKDAKASFSNYGWCIDWFAPGVSVTSAYFTDDIATATMSGTSMATPHTAGAAALFLQRNPGATPTQVRDGLYLQATKGNVTSAASANNHLLYTLPDTDNSYTPPPNSSPTAALVYQCINLDCAFTDQSSDVDGVIASRVWDFGDGTSSTARSPKHAYAESGSYSVKLTAKDNSGSTESVTASVTARVIDLSVAFRKAKGYSFEQVSWSGASTPTVDIYKNFAKLATIANTGAYIEMKVGKGKLTGNTYQICEAGSLVCSAWVSP